MATSSSSERQLLASLGFVYAALQLLFLHIQSHFVLWLHFMESAILCWTLPDDVFVTHLIHYMSTNIFIELQHDCQEEDSSVRTKDTNACQSLGKQQ